MTRVFPLRTAVFSGLALLAVACQAQTHIRVNVTTTGPVGLAPVFSAFHDGSYSIFEAGTSASEGLELLAEVGNSSRLISELPASATADAFPSGGPIAPNGASGSMVFSVADTQDHFSFAAMVLPSNDWFIGNATAIDISSLLGQPVGESITFNAEMAYDAGTESEDFAFSPGNPLVGITTKANPAGGMSTDDGVVTMVSGPDPFASFLNIEPTDFDTSSIDFTTGAIATVSLTVVPEPATGCMAGLVFLGIALFRRCRL